MNRIHPIEYYDKALNIIGIYKLAKKVVDMKVKEAPWANFKNKNMPEYRDYVSYYKNYVDNESDSKLDCDHCDHCDHCNDTIIRNTGFSLLSNRENVTRYLKKTKFCQVLINKGECKREVCNFAHSINEIVFPDCAFGENCKKKEKCACKHPHETEDSYKFRIGFTIPHNIAR